jgi:hypothetical protein
MIKYKDLEGKEDIKSFNRFLKEKYGSDYDLIRKSVLLEIHEKYKDRNLPKEFVDELAYLDIK